MHVIDPDGSERRKADLVAPESYRKATHAERAAVCNGCGSKGLGGWIVPDTLYGLSISDACNVHDWCYAEGVTHDDKLAADRLFLDNMYRIIEAESVGFLKPLRRLRARNYFRAVDRFGDAAYWSGKAYPEHQSDAV